MAEDYFELLDAAIRYLEEAKASGEKWVAISDTTWAAFRSQATSGSTRPRVARSVGVAIPIKPPVPASAIDPSKVARPQPPPNQALATAPPPAIKTPEPLLPSNTPSQVETSIPGLPPGAGIAELRTLVLACQKCPHLVASRKSVVFGVGDSGASLMFVGEAPGADEDKQGEPFVGAAGQLLTRIIKTMGFTRETVYIANVLKCRPDTPGKTSGNRKPTPQEMQTCLPYLVEQIRQIRPKVIVALGATAVEGLFGKPVAITKLRGKWQTFEGIPVMPTYHPSYLLRNQALAVKREVWEDMLQVLERLGAPISDKQRNYFRE